MNIGSFEDVENGSIQYLSRRPDFALSYDMAGIRRQYADAKLFMPGRPAQAIASFLSGRSFDSIAQRLMVLLSIARFKISFDYRNVYLFNIIVNI